MPGTALIGTQWGDEGKGKMTDILAESSDVVVRCTGGDNAGHTIVVGGQTYKLRLLPSGILYGHVTPVIGNGVVLNPKVLLEEIDAIEAQGLDASRLRISGNAHLIMPFHLEFDKVMERFLGRQQLGTTKKGIGPAYADKAMRTGIRVQDILDAKIFRKKVEAALRDKNQVLTKIYGRLAFEEDAIVDEYLAYAERLAPMVGDTSLYIAQALVDGKNVLFEGAQGTLLDLDHGTYPFVTSSNPIASGMATGAGVGPRAFDKIIGITKAYVTRVGSGPFPTELHDEAGEQLSRVGAEFGTVTGRKRRCGWFDAVLLRYAVRLNTLTTIALTKLDVLSGFDRIKICVGYEISNPQAGQTTTVTEMPFHQTDFHNVSPIYEELPGWQTDISDVRKFDQLPERAQAYIRYIEDACHVPVSLVSVGPGREQILQVS